MTGSKAYGPLFRERRLCFSEGLGLKQPPVAEKAGACHGRRPVRESNSGQDAAFGLGAPFLRQDKLKRRPYNYREGTALQGKLLGSRLAAAVPSPASSARFRKAGLISEDIG